MSETATVTIASVTSKDTSAGTMYLVRDGNGTEYATKKAEFFEKAKPLEGKQAVIEFKVATKESNGKTYTNRYLEGIKAVEGSPAAAIAAHDANGNADWDLIALRKTRCALWVAFLQSPMLAVPELSVSGVDLIAAGKTWVATAERDIFFRPVPSAEPGAGSLESSDEDIPF